MWIRRIVKYCLLLQVSANSMLRIHQMHQGKSGKLEWFETSKSGLNVVIVIARVGFVGATPVLLYFAGKIYTSFATKYLDLFVGRPTV